MTVLDDLASVVGVGVAVGTYIGWIRRTGGWKALRETRALVPMFAGVAGFAIAGLSIAALTLTDRFPGPGTVLFIFSAMGIGASSLGVALSSRGMIQSMSVPYVPPFA